MKMDIATYVDQLWLALRGHPLLVHLVLLETLFFVATVVFWLRLRRISRDLARLRSRARQISDAIDAANPSFAEYRNALHALK